MSYQYYPTGAHTAAKMWSLFKNPVRHVCDPSAGKGNLIRYAKEGFLDLSEEQIPWVAAMDDEDYDAGPGGWRIRLRESARKKFSDLRDVSAVEIDMQHHASLKELDVKIIGYNFLEVQSLASVSHVIMNPPFAEGAEHVLHAWSVVYDAEIVAIINAESIKNPYSQARKRLVELIEKHGTVEFLQSEFVDDVERKTSVEVALIYLEKVPSKYLDIDALLSGLMKGDNYMSEVDPEVCTALALPSNFIEDTCFRFEQAVEAARNASEADAVAAHLVNGIGFTLQKMQAMGVGNDARKEVGNVRNAANADFKKRYIEIKERAWAQILRSSLLTDKLSNQARRKIEASAASIYDMEFSVTNVHAFLSGVIQSMGGIYSDMICDLFDTIIERSSDNVVFYKSWKSNQKHRVGVRIRRTRFIIPNFRSSYDGTPDYESQRFLADIDKVFGYLHGITDNYDGLVDGLRINGRALDERISTRFFDFRYYRGAGTIHFYPKSQEVVEKINQFVGKLRNWIPGNMDDANQDFQKQYDKGESLTKEYLERRPASGRSLYGRGNPAWQLLQAVKGERSCDTDQLEQLESAIDEVHKSMGLQCGPALTSVAPLKAITLVQPDKMRPSPPELQQQLSLVA